MYEDRTEENILEELLERIEKIGIVNTNEGSLVHTAESSNAITYGEIYAALRYLYEQLCISTMDLEHLIEKGNEMGIYYNYATQAVYKAIFLCQMEIGDSFTIGDLTFVLTEDTGNETIDGENYYTYKSTCQTEGTEGNNCFGIFETFLGANEEYNDDGRNYKLLIAASDDEDEEIYRERLILKLKAQEFAGNMLSYITTISQMTGVQGVKPIPRTSTSDTWTYKIYILASGGTVPSQELIQTIQDTIDPSTDVNNLTGIYGLPELANTSGKGYGLAPADHVVAIIGVEKQEINTQLQITFAIGMTFTDIQNKIEKVIDDYLSDIINAEKDGWKSSYSLTVKRSEIMSRIVNEKISGVEDVINVTVGKGETTVNVPYTKIPVRGTVTCTKG